MTADIAYDRYCIAIYIYLGGFFMPVKYIFVTGGVVSGLGKGITAASIGRLLKARGFSVSLIHISILIREQ